MTTVSLSPGACLHEAPPAKASRGGQALRRRQGRTYLPVGKGGGEGEGFGMLEICCKDETDTSYRGERNVRKRSHGGSAFLYSRRRSRRMGY